MYNSQLQLFTPQLEVEQDTVLYTLLLPSSQKVSEVFNSNISIYLQSTVKPVSVFNIFNIFHISV
jgi:hypothetical protein